MRQDLLKTVSACFASIVFAGASISSAFAGAANPDSLTTKYPIKHLVIIFGENESFDHYFGTYPVATNPAGEPSFTAAPGTPVPNNYQTNPNLLTANPNNQSANGAGATNPFRIDRAQAHTGSQNHSYGPEEEAFDNGKMDLFPKYTGAAGVYGTGTFNNTGLVMGYFDGNTVTALWNYAQNFAMSDTSFGTNFGPSSVGAVNVISGQTNGAEGFAAGSNVVNSGFSSLVADGVGGYTMYGDSDPHGDVCSSTTAATTTMTGKNIGDLLNAAGITWGWFQGGFDLTKTNSNGTTGCARSTTSATVGAYENDYVQHHQPFQYYASTRNERHLRPSSVAAIGSTDVANHQYDINDFNAALQAGNLPSVSFLKAPAIGDAHPGNSDPLDEQAFVVNEINLLQQSPEWQYTAVIIAYDDSDGWYDHVNNVLNPSTSTQDAYLGTQKCGPLGSTGYTNNVPPSNALVGVNGQPVNGRCGYGPRLPFLVISPYAQKNYIDHTVISQASVVRFIEDNWLNGQRILGSFDAVSGPIDNMFNFNQTPTRTLILDPNMGTVVSQTN